MEFKNTEAEAREMARFEEEVGCDISAGPNWGIRFGKVLEFVLNQPDHGKFVELLKEQYGAVLSPEEIEDVAAAHAGEVDNRDLSPETSVDGLGSDLRGAEDEDLL